jgi:uncharacterized protein YjdB
MALVLPLMQAVAVSHAQPEIVVQVNPRVQDIGWMGWFTNPDSDTNFAGTIGRSKRLEAVQIRLLNFPYWIRYVVHVQNIGCPADWTKYTSRNDRVSPTR